jgi:hypothetical protein
MGQGRAGGKGVSIRSARGFGRHLFINAGFDQKNFIVRYFDGQRTQRRARARTRNTAAGEWLVESAMILANEMAAIRREEALIPIIQRKREVPASVLVRHNAGFMKSHKALARDAFLSKIKSNGLARPELVQRGNPCASR